MKEIRRFNGVDIPTEDYAPYLPENANVKIAEPEKKCICGDIECAVKLNDNPPPYEYIPTEEEKEEIELLLRGQIILG